MTKTAILVDENSRVMVQGITGGTGSFHTRLMLDNGTNIVGGVRAGRGGERVHGVPVYDTVKECVREQRPNVTVLFVPAPYVKEAAFEAMDGGLKTIIVVPERIPIHDMLEIRAKAKGMGAVVLGGNTPGVISPGRCLVGIIPALAFTPGRIGSVTRSGSMLYYVADTLTHAELGESTCVGLGGDPILGSDFQDILRLFEEDDETDGVVLVGEIGGVYEEMAADCVAKMSKPVVAFIAGRYAPSGKRMGHAGAIIERGLGTAESKIEALQNAGAKIAKSFLEIPKLLQER
ncbi:MAG: succinate--CoA ligase subunit alpha [Candidatus Geothermarchaeales archaeon]